MTFSRYFVKNISSYWHISKFTEFLHHKITYQLIDIVKEPPKKEDMNEDELESYTKGVQKRIKKLTSF